MFNRFVDWFSQSEGDSDFSVRNRGSFFPKLIVLFFIAFVVLLITAYMSQTGGMLVYIIALSLVIGSLAWFTTYFVVTHRDAVLTAEFQNTLFSAAAGLNQRYCLIAQKDGTIAYYDGGFRKYFPQTNDQYASTLERAFSQVGVPGTIVSQVYETLRGSASARILMPQKDGNGQFILQMDPLARPRGYWVLRARDYIEKRAEGADVQNAILPILTAALAELPLGILVANREGRLMFVSRPLEVWLGYGEGEIAASALAMRDIIYQQDQGRPNVLTMDAMHGPFTFQHKNGTLLIARTRQLPFISGVGMVNGCSGIVDIPKESPRIPA